MAEELIRVARQHASDTQTEVEYVLGSAEDHAATCAEQYDIVTCMEMLEHVPDPAAVITALARLVRPGGHVVVSTINRTPRAYALAVLGAEYVLRLLPKGTHTYEKFLRPSEMAHWAREVGLEDLDVSGLAYDPFARRASLVTDARVNYLMRLHKPGPAS
jgi:2-polyprenyl-6-hydroxyphenyl methylase/3-demethylubiquinone-9 3-methyltransferase